MSNPYDQMTLKRVYRMLQSIADLSMHCSITGHLDGGARTALAQYNLILDHLTTIGIVPPGLFNQLPESSTYDDIGVSSKLLTSFIEEDIENAEKEPTQLAQSDHDRKTTSELRALGELLREHLPPDLLLRVATGPMAQIVIDPIKSESADIE